MANAGHRGFNQADGLSCTHPGAQIGPNDEFGDLVRHPMRKRCVRTTAPHAFLAIDCITLRAAVAGQEASISHVRLVCRVYSNLGLTLCSGHAGFDTESTSAVIGLQCPVDAGSPTWLHHFSSARFPPPPNQRVLFADFPTIVQASPMYRRSDMPNEACSTVLVHIRR
jgi:hypothetical protein